MKVKEIMELLNLKLLGGEGGLLKEVNGVYVCDLLSWVMAHASPKDAWVTIQTHPNIVAVGALLDLSCIIIPENAEVDEETIKKANEECIPILTSCENGYRICTFLYDIMRSK